MGSDLRNIIKDNRSGSITIAKQALKVYRDLVEQAAQRSGDLETLYKSLQDASKTLIKSQPNMVLLRKTGNNLLLYLKRLIKTDNDHQKLFEAIGKKIQSIEEEMDQNIERIAQLGAKVIAPGNKVITISNSTLVSRILLIAEAQKRRFEAFCLKSHPPDEGIDMAELLSDHGVKTTLISDAEMGTFISQMNLVLLGADRLFEDGFINKSGSLPLCVTARYFNIPVYLTAETTKILSESERIVRIYAEDTHEIYNGKKDNINVENFYYERIPLELVHKIICEDGVFETSEFINWYLKE